MKKNILFSVAVFLTILSTFMYLIVRTLLFIIEPYLWYEKIVAFFLLCAESFILIHSLGYFLNIFNVMRHPNANKSLKTNIPKLETFPPVAIIVASYKEPLDVVEDTITCFYNLTYPNKNLYFLDDTRYDISWDTPEKMATYKKNVEDLCERIGVNLFRRKWHGAKAGMINDFIDFVEGKEKEEFVFYPYQEKKRKEKEKYLIVFDADMNPFPDFVEPLVSIMETNPNIAFVQTPQYYSNFEFNRVARAAGLQQAVFYEYICEGKSQKDAMFCCGTNVIFRIDALVDVGGFDESSVTEDFATSLKFHTKGWSSGYLNKVCAFGMGPEDLGGYFKQQFRWALGTVGLFRDITKEFFKNPLKLKFSKWWEYFLSGTHYFVGWVFVMMAYCPMLYLYFKIPSYFSRPELYFIFFAPYIILSFVMFFSTLLQRHYSFSDLLQGILLNAISFPIYMKASGFAMLGIRGTFDITPKGQSKALPLTSLLPQIITAILSFGAVVIGILRIYYERYPIAAIAANTFWCFYHFLILSSVLWFNHAEEKK
ncbi:MAG: glycosyltransferase [Desulfobacterales bacterium]|nr:glycosyltransferase [Desulfobacterales bacterium]MBF0397291.1 glycosyltransferase [Desulfobacterales bacterium]